MTARERSSSQKVYYRENAEYHKSKEAYFFSERARSTSRTVVQSKSPLIWSEATKLSSFRPIYIRDAHPDTLSRIVISRKERLSLDYSKNIGEIFYSLRNQLIKETIFISSPISIIMNKNYQRIIGLGPAVVPHLIRSLNQDGWKWDWALECITSEELVSEENKGNSEAVKLAWTEWYHNRNKAVWI